MKLLTVLLMSLVANVGFADHTGDNAPEIARTAYRAADYAEALSDQAYREGGWHVGEAVELKDIVAFDHRHETLRDLAQASHALHMALSDLYYAARNGRGSNGSTIRYYYNRSYSAFRNVQSSYRNLSPYQYSRHIDYLYNNLESSFRTLEWAVNGR